MAKVDGDELRERYEKARAEYQEHQKRERQKRRKLKAKQDLELAGSLPERLHARVEGR